MRCFGHLKFLSVSVAILLFGACAKIPPGAATHAARLKEYESKTRKASDAAWARMLEGFDFTIDTWITTEQADWTNYIKEMGEAADGYKTSAVKLDDFIKALNANKLANAGIAPALSALESEATALRAQLLEKEKKLRGYVADAEKTQKADKEALNSYKRNVHAKFDPIRIRINSSLGDVEEGIQLQKELLDSYLQVQISRKAFFGPKFSDKIDELKESGTASLKKVDDIMGSLSSFADLLTKK
jgi:hypothetical protein